jgi:hypothetical protein
MQSAGFPGVRCPRARLFAHAISITAAFSISALAGCGMPGAPQPPSLNLPNRVTSLSAVRTGDRVELNWKMPIRNTDKVTLKAPITARVCRNESSATRCNAITTLQFAPGADATFTDSLPSALATGLPHPTTYFVELVNRKGRSAGLSNGVPILAGAAPPAVEGLTAEVVKSGVLLHWLPASSPSSPASVRLLRTLLTPPEKKLAQGPAAAPAEPTKSNFIVAAGTPPDRTSADRAPADRALDTSIIFGESYEYRAQRVVRAAENGVSLELAGPLSAPVRVTAVDTFPPAVPQGLAAVATAGENGNLPASGNPPAIDLSWQPDTDADLAGYIVYRREAGGWQRISPAQPVVGPGFHDANVQPGHTYNYAVSAVSENGRESARSAEAQEIVPGP